MIRFAAELWAILACCFLVGGLVGWLLSRLLRPLFGRLGPADYEDADDAEALVPLPEPVVLVPPPLSREEQSVTIDAAPLARPAVQRERPRAAPLAPRRPPALPGPRHGKADALLRLPGLSRRHAERLYAIGIYHFGQIAAWTPQEAAWISSYLDLGDTIRDEDWIGRAARLAAAEPGGRRPRN